MDPTKQYLEKSPRNLSEDAFFSSDRSNDTVTRNVTAYDLPQPTKNNPTDLAIAGWKNRVPIQTFSATNPLPQQRKTTSGAIDPAVQGWTHTVTYTSISSTSTDSLQESGRVRVVILFGTGSEYYRHGLCGIVNAAQQPTIFIDVPGIESTYEITFTNPSTGVSSQPLPANNSWGVGITEDSIRGIVAQHVPKSFGYDVVVCAAYSTGYLGLAGSINRRLFSFASLERAIAFDCLYVYLGQALLSLKTINQKIQLVAYIATGGGNSYTDDQHPTFQSLSFGNKPGMHYVNLFFNPFYYAVTAARVLTEGVAPTGNAIITDLTRSFETTLTNVAGRLPPRGTLISDPVVFKTVKGSVPSNAVTLASFAAANSSQITQFFSMASTIKKCLQNGQLLGWPTPPGEEWHDFLLIEFAWEYLI